jgi:hypothetical protein
LDHFNLAAVPLADWIVPKWRPPVDLKIRLKMLLMAETLNR